MTEGRRPASWTSLGVLVLALLLVIASGCGNGKESGNEGARGNDAVSGTGAAGGNGAFDGSDAAGENGTADGDAKEMRTVSTVKGDIEIPADPQKVMAGYYHGTLLALGIQPIGASKEWWMGSPFLKEQEKSIEDVGSPLNVEKVASMEPDLIVINDLLAEQYDQLSKIAPTLLVPYGSTNNIREEVKLFGELLNKGQAAEAWLADYESRAAKAREKLKEIVPPGATATLLEIDGKTLAVLGDNYGRGGEVIYNALKFRAPDWVRKNVIDNQVQYQEISMEKLPEIANTDYIFLSTYTETTEEQLKQLTSSAIWQSLPAVKNGRMISLDYNTYFYFDPVSTVGQIDKLTDTLLNASAR